MKFDATEASVFGIPPYVFFVGLGALFAFACFNLLMCLSGANVKAGNRAALIALPAMAVGAKLFGIILNLIDCIAYGNAITLDIFIYSGIVFYGGLLFFVFTFLFVIRKYSGTDKERLTDSAAVSIPMFHAFGRIGCFSAGCCYGIPYDGFLSVTYTTWVNGSAATENRVPIQLIEALFNLIIFGILLLLFLRKYRSSAEKRTYNLLIVYFILYAVLRLFDEFLRGDTSKNILYAFSFAQTISLAILICISIKFIFVRKKRNVK